MSINLVFKEKGKQNVIIKGSPDMPFSELIQKYFKNICASKKDKIKNNINFLFFKKN